MKVFIILSVSLSTVLFGALAAQNIKVEQKGNLTAFTNTADVVSYTSKKNDPKFLSQIKQKYNGLSNKERINDLLKKQNYIEVLNYVWSEPDSRKKLEWLEAKANEGHPLLMLELGEEYYNQNPTVYTYVTKTLPWILAGTRRTYIDAVCSSDKSVTAAPDYLLVEYRDRILKNLLSKISQEDLEKNISKYNQEFQKNNLAILKKVLEPIVNNDPHLPSPQWVFAHGLAAFSNEKNSITPEQCADLRKKEAKLFLDQIAKIEKSQGD